MGSTGAGSDWFSGIAAATTGLGILTFTFFPFALPILILTAVVVLPLALPVIALMAVAGILTGTWRGIRAGARGISRLAHQPRRRASGRVIEPRPRPC